MSDITVKYGSTGFDKIARELADLEKQAGGAATWFAPMRQQLKETEDAGSSFGEKMKGVLSGVTHVGGSLLETLVKIAGGIAAVAAIAAGAATVGFTSWAMSVLKTTESFRMLEISLYGATKSWEAVGVASKFAAEYAAEYPAMYGDVMKALQSFAYIPALKPMITGGDVDAMKEMMTIVQGLMTMRPEQGVGGAIWALREALAGNWRTLMMRFDVPIASIAKSAGMTMEQMKQSPESAVKALKAFINEFVGAETMAMMAKNLGIQVGNLKDKYEMWLDKLGKTGVYQKVVDYIIKLNDFMEKLMKSEKVEKWTKAINDALEGVADRIAKVFTEGVNWEDITDLQGLVDALKKVAENAAVALRDLWDSIKEPMFNGLKSVFKAIGEGAKPILKDVFIPMGMEIASFIVDGILGFMKEHPIISSIMLGFKGATLGGQIAGKWGAIIGGGAGVLGGAMPWLIDAIKGLFGGSSADEAKKSLSEVAATADGVTDEQKEEIGSIREVNTNLDAWTKSLDSLIADLRGTKAGGIPGGGTAELTEKQIEAQKKLVALEEQGQWSQYQAWSRMGMQMARAPEEGGVSAWGKYLKGQMSWEQMKQAEKVEKFQKSQLGELEKMTLEQKEKEEPNYGMLSRTYGEMFNISYQRGDFAKAQEYMNASLQAMRDDIKAQAAAAEKELGAVLSTATNCEKMEGHLSVIRDEFGNLKALMPAARDEPFDPYRGYNVRSKSMAFSDQPLNDSVAKQVSEDLVE